MKRLALALTALALSAGAASALTVTVPGTANPFLAGATAGDSITMNGATDTFAIDAPTGIAVSAGHSITIAWLSGEVSNTPTCCTDPVTGGAPISSSLINSSTFTVEVNGYSNLPINSLIGVFWGPTLGTQNVVEIGAGGTFVVPTGATEFYLATADGYEWNNNTGAFSVDATVVPEPAAWLLMLGGFAGLGAGLRLRRRFAAA
ncbi:MAG TPA: PEP-CTERM sorting domain-containing protein [Caulobacteraceae bacterium]|jgi:hypothetical protein